MKKINHFIEAVFGRILILVYSAIGFITKKRSIMFMPHSRMCIYDKYDIINYKSDNALSLFNYIIKKSLLKKYTLYVVLAECTEKERIKRYLSTYSNDYDIRIIYYFSSVDRGLRSFVRKRIELFRAFIRSKYIFTSLTYEGFPLRHNKQQLIDLNYFSVPFKNDMIDPDSPLYRRLKIRGNNYTSFVVTSELALRVIFPTMSIDYHKYKILGMCRNDNLLDGNSYDEIRNSICSKVEYKVKKVFLYTPTHRDYEKNNKSISRFLLGFDMDMDLFEHILESSQSIIIAKIHPKQNFDVIKKLLPRGVILHSGEYDYGLTELMQISDALITDYTSVYFDYLLLDKPIIFNFYDIEKYNETRGFSYDPIESILAGQVVSDADTFIKAIQEIEIIDNISREKRDIIKKLFFKDFDTDTCKRVIENIVK